MASQIIGKFRGCLAGSIIGDCFGAPFENDFPVSKAVLTNFFQRNLLKYEDGKMQILPYTDDTAMTKSVALSLIENKGFDPEDMAKRFTDEYFKQPRRGYGLNVGAVFQRLKNENFSDVYKPAKEQFEGSGSYGNGGAMRISPLALFFYNSDTQTLIDIARQSTMLTHTHQDGYNGAILQCLAIHQALKAKQLDTLDSSYFLDQLISHLDKLEQVEPRTSPISKGGKKPYCAKLATVKEALKESDITAEEIAVLLGNDVSAINSVPTAIYAFLRGQNPLNEFQCDNPFLRTLYLSILFGGDTDTIASMACSIAGSYYGIDVIPQEIRDRCEDMETMLDFANRMSKLAGLN